MLAILQFSLAVRITPSPRMASGDASPSVMINGLPGAMGLAIAAVCERRGVRVAPFALTGPGMPSETAVGDVSVALYPPDARDELAARVKAEYPEAGSLICIDFTLPVAVNGNAEWYAANGLPFVMGTTGGDREALKKTVEDAKTYCVIAPNMAKQIVALQAALEGMAADFPGSFAGYTLTCDESHQSSKVDTSGTAKALSATLAALNGDGGWGDERIVRVRDVDEQRAGGGASHRGVSPVPEDALGGHAFHTYSLVSEDGLVEFQFRHNVQGRSVYAEGTVDAAVFLARRVAAADARTSYTMIDVLRAGAMD